MGAMALGLFSSLLIGTIIKTLAENICTPGLVGPIGIITGWTKMPEGITVTAVDWIGLILLCFVLPILLTGMIGWIMRKKGIIQDGDLKIDLG